MKRFFSDLNLQTKITLVLLLFGLGGILTSAVIGFEQGAIAVDDSTQRMLLAARDNKKVALQTYFDQIQAQLRVLAGDYSIVEGMAGFSLAYESGPTAARSAYLTRNPNPPGQRALYSDAKDGTPYSEAHAHFHSQYLEYQREFSFGDLLLVDLKGNVIYSVNKDDEFGTSLYGGRYAGESVAAVFREAAEGDRGTTVLQDFSRYAAAGGAPAAFAASPIFNDSGKKVGVLMVRIPIERVNTVMQNHAGLGRTGESYLVGADSLMRSDSRFSRESTVLNRKISTGAARDALKGKSGVMELRNFRGVEVVSAFTQLAIGKSPLALIVEIERSEVREPLVSLLWRVVAFTLVAALAIVAASYYIARYLARPVVQLVETNRRIAVGDLTARIQGQRRAEEQDEFAKLTRSTNSMAENLENLMIRVRAHAARVVSDGESINSKMHQLQNNSRTQLRTVDETSASIEQMGVSIREVADNSTNLSNAAASITEAMDQLSRSITSVMEQSKTVTASVDDTSSSIEEMAASIQGVSGNINEILGAASVSHLSAAHVDEVIRTVAQNTDMINRSVEDMSGAIEELAANIREIRRSAEAAGTIASENATDAKSGMDALGEAIGAMNSIHEIVMESSEVVSGLSTSAENIGDIVDVIDDLAEQTNLLALNAAIEAARAGEHGRGFAVVAEEVRKLAERSQESTKNISDLIYDIQQKSTNAVTAMEKGTRRVAEGTRLAENSGAVLKTIVTGIERNLSLVNAISTASVEQHTASDQVIRAVGSVSEQMTVISAAMENLKKAGDDIVRKNLSILQMAQNIAKSTGEQSQVAGQITDMVSSMQDGVHKNLGALREQASAVQRTAADVAGMTREIQQINRALKEQRTGAERIILAVDSVSRIAEDNTRQVSATTEDTVHITTRAGELGELISQFTVNEEKARRMLAGD